MCVDQIPVEALPQERRLLKAVPPSVLAFAVPYRCCRADRRWMPGAQWLVGRLCCTRTNWCGRLLRKRYPPGASSTESGACVRPGFCSTVWVLPRSPALDARRAMESVALVLHSHGCVWQYSPESRLHSLCFGVCGSASPSPLA